MIIAIDGPAGAGKSTIARGLAKALELDLLDTGAMYRAFALAAQRKGIDFDVAELIHQVQIDFGPTPERKIRLDGVDVSEEIRSLEISQMASQLSTVSEVRRAMVAAQQSIIGMGNWVLEGRDVTTVVAPKADLKIFLTASIEERARRRWVEMVAKGDTVTLPEVVKEVVERDHRDYTRNDSPLMLAEDAIIVESFGLSPDEIIERIIAMAQ
jgi:cytidylate kinase